MDPASDPAPSPTPTPATAPAQAEHTLFLSTHRWPVNGIDMAFLHLPPLGGGAPGAAPARPEGRPARAGAAPLVLVLHGFPDTPFSFLPVARRLAAAGYRVVLPFLRGYPPGVGGASRVDVPTLARDALALIDELGYARAALVGHDWGSVVAHHAAGLRPDRVGALAALAVPHVRGFVLRPTRAQLKRSSYMAAFQWPWAAARLRAHGAARLDALIRRWSPGLPGGLHHPAFAALREAVAQPGRLHAMLGYYRALKGALLLPETWSVLLAPQPVPTLQIFGARDGCIGPELFARAEQEHLYAGGLVQHELPDAGHFMHVERPAEVGRALLAHLARFMPVPGSPPA